MRKKVSVICLTYNTCSKSDGLQLALKSVLDQKTNFDFEFIIRDDASTDQTPEVCKAFAEAYPSKIRFYQNETNLGTTKNLWRTFEDCTGEYWAGIGDDDLWIGEHKLQKQVDFMDANPDYAMHFMRCALIDRENHVVGVAPYDSFGDFSVWDFWWYNIPNQAALFRRKHMSDFSKKAQGIKPEDAYMQIYIGMNGKTWVDEEVGGIVRLGTGHWSTLSFLDKAIFTVDMLYHCFWDFGCQHLEHAFPSIYLHTKNLKRDLQISGYTSSNAVLFDKLEQFKEHEKRLGQFIENHKNTTDFKSILEKNISYPKKWTPEYTRFLPD